MQRSRAGSSKGFVAPGKQQISSMASLYIFSGQLAGLNVLMHLLAPLIGLALQRSYTSGFSMMLFIPELAAPHSSGPCLSDVEGMAAFTFFFFLSDFFRF